MKLNKEVYKKYAMARAKKSNTPQNCMRAFVCGGGICTLAQLIRSLYQLWLGEELSATLTSVTLIFTASLLTGLGIFDKIAKFAGAGTLVPITGFSNAVTAAAIDAKDDECDIIGLSRKAP